MMKDITKSAGVKATLLIIWWLYGLNYLFAFIQFLSGNPKIPGAIETIRLFTLLALGMSPICLLQISYIAESKNKQFGPIYVFIIYLALMSFFYVFSDSLIGEMFGPVIVLGMTIFGAILIGIYGLVRGVYHRR